MCRGILFAVSAAISIYQRLNAMFSGTHSGQSLLLNGAGGGVGTFALQIAKLYDAEITVVDRAGKLDMLRALGAHHAIDYRVVDFTRTGKRYDLILDTRSTRSPLRTRLL